MLKVAILDDHANAALSFGDWSTIKSQAEITVFQRHIDDDEVANVLQPFEILCVIRERTPVTAAFLDKLPNLKALILSDDHIRTIDRAAAAERGIAVVNGLPPQDVPMSPHDTAEFVWGLLLAMVRRIPQQVESLRRGEWRHSLGMSLANKKLGVAGLGRTGSRVARYANAFDMKVLAWSQNLTEEAAAQAGAELVDKETLFRESDIVTIHYALSERSIGLVGARELGMMKPTAYLLNTSRGPIVDEQALIDALENGRIAGAALDVFDQEPLPKDHPLLKLDNVVATPHLGFITEGTMHYYYASIAAALAGYLQERHTG